MVASRERRCDGACRSRALSWSSHSLPGKLAARSVDSRRTYTRAWSHVRWRHPVPYPPRKRGHEARHSNRAQSRRGTRMERATRRIWRMTWRTWRMTRAAGPIYRKLRSAGAVAVPPTLDLVTVTSRIPVLRTQKPYGCIGVARDLARNWYMTHTTTTMALGLGHPFPYNKFYTTNPVPQKPDNPNAIKTNLLEQQRGTVNT
jgi:hypothetical protein